MIWWISSGNVYKQKGFRVHFKCLRVAWSFFLPHRAGFSSCWLFSTHSRARCSRVYAHNDSINRTQRTNIFSRNQQWKSRDESRTKEVKATKGQLDKLYPLRRRRSPSLQIDGLNWEFGGGALTICLRHCCSLFSFTSRFVIEIFRPSHRSSSPLLPLEAYEDEDENKKSYSLNWKLETLKGSGSWMSITHNTPRRIGRGGGKNEAGSRLETFPERFFPFNWTVIRSSGRRRESVGWRGSCVGDKSVLAFVWLIKDWQKQNARRFSALKGWIEREWRTECCRRP